MFQIDARGLACPEPVVLTMNAVKSGKKEIEVLLDAVPPIENVTRYAKSNGFEVTKTVDGNTTKLLLKK